MQNFLKLSDIQRRTIYEQIALRVGISDPRAIEKDMWVSSLLQIVFGLPYADKFVFKGGSSLSKIWKLIHRFSEDIDLAIDRSLFGLEGDLTKKQLKKLRKESSLFVKDRLAIDITESLNRYNLDGYCDVIPEPNGEGDDTYPEPRKIHIAYNFVFDTGDGYLRPEVLLEVGARSLFEPTSQATVKSMISESSEIKTSIADTMITCAVPQKTFLEKAFLLHELFTTEMGMKANRKSRHLYDLEHMMAREEILSAVNNAELWETIRHHREVYTSIRGVDYTPDIRRRIVLIPPKEFESEWRKDYEAMQKSMIYGDEMSYDELISRIGQLQELFRNV